MAFEEAPPFWWHKKAWQAWLLWPVSLVYGKVSARRMTLPQSDSVDVPVICVGNLISGGAGKTPVVLTLGAKAIEFGYKPGFLSRGHGGAVNTATLVDPEMHNSHDVGDEALILARTTTTVVSADRVAGANLLVDAGCDLIIMDDGFQNPYLHKDFNLVVVNSRRGLGNGHCIPGGPLRAPLDVQLLKTDAIVVMGDEDNADGVIRQMARRGRPIFSGQLVYDEDEPLKGKWVCAYAGIGDPEKFFDGLTSLGAEIVDRFAYGDHHRYHDDECEELLGKAKLMEAMLVTTEKDAARLKRMGAKQAELYDASHVLRVHMEFEDDDTVRRIFKTAVKRHKARRV